MALGILLSLQNNKLDMSSRSKAMIRHIFSYARDDLLYDSSATRTVSETLTADKANCLSLSILAYSMAQELGLDAVFQTAMFYNNKAAEQQNFQHYAQAYQYYQAAIAADPEFAVTWANLALLYR